MSLPGGVSPFYDNIKVFSAQIVLSVTPSDVAVLPAGVCRAFYVSAAGNVTALDNAGNSFTIPLAANQVGLPIWISVTKVMATGTTATGIYALY